MTLLRTGGSDRVDPVRGGGDRTRTLATGLLILMAIVFAVARAMDAHHPAWGFVRAFAEAAMVGGLADWFAVTALFRHPLGLPIPHTAIIPRNKDRIGDNLATFLRDNFLTASIVARRMRRLDLATAAGRILAQPRDAHGRIREGASRLAADILESLDRERLGGMVKGAIGGRLRTLNVSPLIGQALGAAMAEDRHKPLIDAVLLWIGRALEANEGLIRDMVSKRAGSILRWTGLDAKLANSIVDGLRRMIDEVGADPHHPVRAKAEEALASLADRLQNDSETQTSVSRLRDEILDNPAITRWIDGMWESARAGLLRAVRDPRATLAGKFGEALRQLGQTLQQDARLRGTINQFARRAMVGAVARYGDAIVRLVSDTIRGWDAETITGRLESAVGRDLQYIRVNGTLVGGLVGLAIHTADVLL
ncbi:MAG: DUF445 domain-containing protein [Sphingomonas sp.]